MLPVFRINADFSIFQKFRTLRTSQKNPRAEIFFLIKMWKLGRSLAKKANLCQRVYIRLGETRLARLARPVTLVGWKRPRLSLRSSWPSLAISSRHLIYDRNLAKFKRKQRRTNKLPKRNRFPAGLDYFVCVVFDRVRAQIRLSCGFPSLTFLKVSSFNFPC